MRRYTTPTITANITGIDLTGYKTFTTLKQGAALLTLEDLPCTTTENGCKLEGVLTQEQTAMFKANEDINIQVRFINSDGVASATNIKRLNVNSVLMPGVISYE